MQAASRLRGRIDGMVTEEESVKPVADADGSARSADGAASLTTVGAGAIAHGGLISPASLNRRLFVGLPGLVYRALFAYSSDGSGAAVLRQKNPRACVTISRSHLLHNEGNIALAPTPSAHGRHRHWRCRC